MGDTVGKYGTACLGSRHDLSSIFQGEPIGSFFFCMPLAHTPLMHPCRPKPTYFPCVASAKKKEAL